MYFSALISVCFLGVKSKGCYCFKSPHPVILSLKCQIKKGQFYQLNRSHSMQRGMKLPLENYPLPPLHWASPPPVKWKFSNLPLIGEIPLKIKVFWPPLISKIFQISDFRQFLWCTNADLKIFQYACIRIQTIHWKFHILYSKNSWGICRWSL